MKKQEFQHTGVRLTKENHSRYMAAAKERGLKVSVLLRNATNFFIDLSPDFIEAMEEQSKDMGILPADLIMSLVHNQFCMNAAFRAVFGVDSKAFQRPFKWTDDGKMVRDEELCKMLFDEYVEIYTRFRDKAVVAVEENRTFKIKTEEVQSVAVATM